MIGMANGMQDFTTAVLGCGVLGAIVGYVWLTRIGRRRRYDVVLHLRWLRPPPEIMELRRLLTRHSRRVVCAARHLAPDGVGTDYSYRLLLRDPTGAVDLVRDVGALPGVGSVTSASVEGKSEA